MLTGESQCEDAKGDQFFFLIELLRLDMDPTLAHFVMKGEQLGHSLTLSSQLNTVGYIQMAPRSHSALYLYVPDPLPNRVIGNDLPHECRSFTGGNATIGLYIFNTEGPTDAAALFATTPSDWFYFHGDSVTHPDWFYQGEYDASGLVLLQPSSSDSLSAYLTLPDLQRSVNFRSTSFISLRSYLETTPALLGLRAAIQPFERSHLGRQMRDCSQAFRLRYGSEVEEGRVSFWRGIYELHPITEKHDQIWSLFVKNRKVSPFLSFQELLVLQDWWSTEDKDSLVLAIPRIELVTCTLDFRRQDFYGDEHLWSRFVKTSLKTQHRVVSSRVLDLLNFDQSSQVFRNGDAGVVVWFDSVQLQSQIRELDRHQRISKSWGKSRRLSDSYADSLVFTNLQLQKRFGSEERRVPAHMPHLLQKGVLTEIERNMSELVRNTVYHRFRSANDLQFSFTYFHWLRGMERQKRDRWLRHSWELFDADGDGFLNEYEFKSLGMRICEDSTCIRELLKCVTYNPRELTRERTDVHGNLWQHVVQIGRITFESVISCDKARLELERMGFGNDMLMKNDEWIAFQMIGDDLNDTIRQVCDENRSYWIAR